MPIRVEVIYDDDSIVSATSAKLSIKLKVNVVGAILVSPGGLLLETLFRAVAVVKQPDVAIPGSRHEDALLAAPIVHARDIFLIFILGFFALLELFHFGSILDVNGEHSAPRVTDKKLSLPLI